jgi:NAD(P)-dependent dehydrogenase (short-subunit alcohol dehydrogenase family)
MVYTTWMRRIGSPAEGADGVLGPCLPASGVVTGSVITVDGVWPREPNPDGGNRDES